MGLFRFKRFLFEQEQETPPFGQLPNDESNLHHAFNLIRLANDVYDRSDGSSKFADTRANFLASAAGHLETAIATHMDHHEALFGHPSLPSPYHTRALTDHHDLIHGLISLHTSVMEQMRSPLMPPVSTVLHQDRDTGSYYVHQHNILTTKQVNSTLDELWRKHLDVLTPVSPRVIEARNNRDGYYRSHSEPERQRIRQSTFSSTMNLGRFMRDHNRDDWDEFRPEGHESY